MQVIENKEKLEKVIQMTTAVNNNNKKGNTREICMGTERGRKREQFTLPGVEKDGI